MFGEDMVRLITLRCREAAALLSTEQEGRLSRLDRWALRLHLMVCRPCRAYRRQLQALARVIDAAVKTLGSEGRLPGGRLSDESRRRLREVIAASAG
jgi:predicted anti-sigma-YlaC factor YlaD